MWMRVRYTIGDSLVERSDIAWRAACKPVLDCCRRVNGKDVSLQLSILDQSPVHGTETAAEALTATWGLL